MDEKEAKDFIVKHKAQQVNDFRPASVHIVPDIASPGRRVTWQSQLLGQCVLSLHGPWICFHPAAENAVSRYLFMTPGFSHMHPMLASVIQQAFYRSPGGWRLKASLN